MTLLDKLKQLFGIATDLEVAYNELVAENAALKEKLESAEKQLANCKRTKNALTKKIELLTEKLQQANDVLNQPTGDAEFVTNNQPTGDAEFVANDQPTGDAEFKDQPTQPVNNRDFEKEAKILAKELDYCWSLRMKHAKDRNGGFSNIEWAGISSNVIAGLSSYTKTEFDDSVDAANINWLIDILTQFDGRL